MKMEETLEEIFDLNPILPEIYTSNLYSNPTSDHAITKSVIMIDKSITSSTSFSAKQLSCTKPSSSSSASQLISFESSNTSVLSLPTISDKPYRSTSLEDYSLTPQIIKFSSSSEDEFSRNEYDDGISQHKGVSSSRTHLQAQDHLMAERKRREKLGQLFIGLSKVVPGLKKLDKASLLEDAIEHLKRLEERVSVLELKKMSSSVNGSSSRSTSTSPGPEIKAKISNRNVLISIWCDQKKGLISRIPVELEKKMNLNVIDMRAMPFGAPAALYITILAEMQSEFRGTVKDIVDHLHVIFFANPRDDHVLH